MNPFKKSEPIQVPPEECEVRVHNYGGMIVQNPYYQVGIYDNHTQQLLNSYSALQQQQYSLGTQSQLTHYQNQINQQMNNISQIQHQMSQPIFRAAPERIITINGEFHSFSEEDYNFLIKAGFEALKKREDFKDDFEKLLK